MVTWGENDNNYRKPLQCAVWLPLAASGAGSLCGRIRAFVQCLREFFHHVRQPFFCLYAERSACRCRSGQPAVDAARRADSPRGGGHLFVDADGAARAAQGGSHRARGNDPRRRHRAVDAGGAARRAVAGIGALDVLRAGAAAPERPARPRFRHRPHPRRGDYRHCAARAEKLSPVAAPLFPDSDQIPRRNPPPLRRHARARICHERRLFLPRRLRRLAARISEHV